MSTPEPPPPPAQSSSPPPPPPPAAPSFTPEANLLPGWYHDGSGMRWWDGAAWGPPAPPVSSDNHGLATFAHLGFVIGGFLLPLIIYTTANDDEQPEVRYHSREALNHQLTMMLVTFASIILALIGVALTGVFSLSTEPGSGAGLGVGVVFFFAFFALIVIVVFGSIVLSIIAAVKASRGERYRYPLCIRFVRS